MLTVKTNYQFADHHFLRRSGEGGEVQIRVIYIFENKELILNGTKV